MARSDKGRPWPARKRVGNPNWRGDDVSYNSAHARTRRERGPAKNHCCVGCDAPARDWALRHGCERIEGDEGWFSPDPQDYDPMCRRCHVAYDTKEMV